jgi:hypothetical protein
MTYNKSAQFLVLCIAPFSYAISFGMDASKAVENTIKYLRTHRIKTVNSMQKMTAKNISAQEFVECIDFKIRLLDEIDQDIKQQEEMLKELSKSKL